MRVGADPNAADCEGSTPLYQASVRGAVNLMRLLLAAGAAPDIESGHGQEGTPLRAAAARGHTGGIRCLAASPGGGGCRLVWRWPSCWLRGRPLQELTSCRGRSRCSSVWSRAEQGLPARCSGPNTSPAPPGSRHGTR
ncbi:ankyrin repeat domain-containing protein [Micromonospora sp. D93]|uniref:ankyrin repeat domain-containing protein n=1 Tax=Micromonospora sp. D93 TaxID=2824886 RepID=UPI001B37EC05|nr:ankyrin repeat domain-containing protein [Micromonospora sp. D93]